MPAFNPNDYVDVQERITRFWAEYPDGAILTTIDSPSDDFERCRYHATIYKHRDDERPSATGWAFELAGGGGANRTSHEENCETSAIGRALANMGYAKSKDDRPSRQEMTKAAADAPPRNRSTTRNTAPDLSGSPQTREPGAQASEHPMNVQRASQEQLHDIKKHLSDLGWGDAELSLVVQSKNRAALAEFTADEAAKLIQFLGKTETAKSWLNTMNPAVATDPAGATQHRFIEAIALDLGITNEALELEVQSSFGCSVTGLNRRDASVLIERLQQRRTERSTQQAQMISTTDAAAKARE